MNIEPVSIRSPRRNEGRRRRGQCRIADIGFNPLPPSKRGETPIWSLYNEYRACFNPLPPSKRGETRVVRLVLLQHTAVSIRSPRRNEGRPDDTATDSRPSDSFNPLPPSKRGETCRTIWPWRARTCFNPLPPSKRGETSLAEALATKDRRFQSAPPVETRGDPSHPRYSVRPSPVSIRSPRRNEGRPVSPALFSPSKPSFNPLPPSKRGETSKCCALPSRVALFQSAPPVETRGDLGGRIPLNLAKSFNPLPPSKRGETWTDSCERGRGCQFQSAPPVETRGDLDAETSPGDTRCFNPLPPSKRGETCRRPSIPLAHPTFQSAPPVETRGDHAISTLNGY